MKKLISLTLVLLLLIIFAFTVLAHPGRTDSNGGHYNRSTGEYHYHHGYPEHQHTNGECPHSFDDKTSIDWDEYYQKAKEKDAEQYNQMKEDATKRASTTQYTTQPTTQKQSAFDCIKNYIHEKPTSSLLLFLAILILTIVAIYILKP